MAFTLKKCTALSRMKQTYKVVVDPDRNMASPTVEDEMEEIEEYDWPPLGYLCNVCESSTSNMKHYRVCENVSMCEECALKKFICDEEFLGVQ